MSPLLPRISLFQCPASDDLDVRGVSLVSILRHKLLCILVFKEILHYKPVCDLKSRIDPYLSHHGRESKLLLVLITLRVLPGRLKAKFLGKNGKTGLLLTGKLIL